MKKNKDNITKICIKLLQVLSILVFAYYVYVVIIACVYLSDLVAQKEIILSQNIGKVIQYVMSQTFSYLFYSISLFVFAYMMNIHRIKE